MKMTRPVSENSAWLGISVAHGASQSLQMQLYELVKRKIEDGTVGAGSRLPSSRGLAAELGIARATVTAAYEQLIAEGYVTSRRGARLEVTEPHTAAPIPTADPKPPTGPSKTRPPMLLKPGVPDLRLFPDRQWIKAATRSWRAGAQNVLGDWDPAGALQLRRAIAAHLWEWRGIKADPDQVLVTAGSAGALQLILDTLTSKGDPIAAEEPGYPAFHRLATRRGLEIIPVPVDGEGMDVEALRRCPAQPRLCVVTPSHQYPSGGAMSIGRRRQLLEWAASVDGLIVEDDYDSEFRYEGRPVPALLSISPEARIIYVGTTSKVLSPAIRIGYIVGPLDIVERLRRTADNLEQRASIIPQYPLAEIIESGDYARHVRRMRRTYRERKRFLVNCLGGMVPKSHLKVSPQAAGLHLLAHFGPALDKGQDDMVLQEKCREIGLGVKGLSFFYRGAERRSGFLIGFAAFEEEEIARGVKLLAGVLMDAAG